MCSTRPRTQLKNDRVSTVRANLSRPRCFFFFCKFFFLRAVQCLGLITKLRAYTYRERTSPPLKICKFIYTCIFSLGFSLLVSFYLFFFFLSVLYDNTFCFISHLIYRYRRVVDDKFADFFICYARVKRCRGMTSLWRKEKWNDEEKLNMTRVKWIEREREREMSDNERERVTKCENETERYNRSRAFYVCKYI